ncbi:MAG TPA: PE-PPE domain-containing protein, partial [Mycobacterium sp.]|nr:PE-PPE domain-containing protein [Mycobacterium sp.]
YTMEYDGFADFPKYPINFLSDLNAYLGIFFNHLQYLGLTPEQIDDAVQLHTSAADTLTDYFMIPSESLPLLDPLRLIPFLGNPLADLLQPDLSVLVNLGYGSITDGWAPGPADVPTPLGFLPPLGVLAQVPGALAKGLWQGVNDAVRDLLHPDNYQLISPETMTAFLGPLLRSAQAEFLWPGASLTDIIKNLIGSSGVVTGFLDNIKSGLTELSFTHTGIPFIDVASAFLNTLPKIDAHIFLDQLFSLHPLDAIGDPVAFDVGVAPLLLIGLVLGDLL